MKIVSYVRVVCISSVAWQQDGLQQRGDDIRTKHPAQGQGDGEGVHGGEHGAGRGEEGGHRGRQVHDRQPQQPLHGTSLLPFLTSSTFGKIDWPSIK